MVWPSSVQEVLHREWGAGLIQSLQRYTYIPIYVQWNLFIKDTLRPANLFTVERLSTIQRWKIY